MEMTAGVQDETANTDMELNFHPCPLIRQTHKCLQEHAKPRGSCQSCSGRREEASRLIEEILVAAQI